MQGCCEGWETRFLVNVSPAVVLIALINYMVEQFYGTSQTWRFESNKLHCLCHQGTKVDVNLDIHCQLNRLVILYFSSCTMQFEWYQQWETISIAVSICAVSQRAWDIVSWMVAWIEEWLGTPYHHGMQHLYQHFNIQPHVLFILQQNFPIGRRPSSALPTLTLEPLVLY